MGKIKSSTFLKFFATVVLSGVFLNTNFFAAGNASEVEFSDQKQNSWIAVSATAKEAELHFNWHSTLDNIKVRITGPNEVSVEGGSSGEIYLTVKSGNAQGEYRFEATKEVVHETDDSDQNNPSFEEYVTSLRLGEAVKVTSIFDPQPASATAQAAKTYLRYQTFIPDSYVGAPPTVCTPDSRPYLFAGDERVFDPNSSAFRTRFQVTVDWVANGALTFSRTVGTTKRYLMGNNGLPIMESVTTATATNEGMVLTQKSTSATLTHYALSHSVTNPMCNSLVTYPIEYEADVWIARSGAYTVTNYYRRAPNHEIYLKDSDENTWTMLMQSYTFSMNCFDPSDKLQPFCYQPFKSVPGSSR